MSTELTRGGCACVLCTLFMLVCIVAVALPVHAEWSKDCGHVLTRIRQVAQDEVCAKSLLVSGFIYFLFEVFITVNHGLLLARLTLCNHWC